MAALKQWSLTQSKTITSFGARRNNLIYTLSLDPSFVPFSESTWEKKTKSKPHETFKDDSAELAERKPLTATQKTIWLR